MACDPDGVIGNNGQIPWKCEDDISFFRAVTHGGTVIMGGRTFLSLPNGFFDDRNGIVFSRILELKKKYSFLYVVNSLDALKEKLQSMDPNKKVFMIGGAQIAELFLTNNLVDDFILTVMKKHYQGDTKINLEHFSKWNINLKIEKNEYYRYHYVNGPLE